MRFKIDENLPTELCDDPRVAGHEADTVQAERLAGAPDAAILTRVQAEGRALLTLDRGIADVRASPPDQCAGIVLFRPRTTGGSAVLVFVRQYLPVLLQSNLRGHLPVVSESGIRIR